MEQDLSVCQIDKSLYIHIPFCLTKCDYCSFYSTSYTRDALDSYVQTVKAEIDLYHRYFGNAKDSCPPWTPRTVYFGGGTPSLLTADQINDILSYVQLRPDTEISIEINPLQITPQYIEKLAQTPINRLSIGLQSMDDAELAFLTRRHKAADLAEKIRLCRSAGFDNISLDLIYGLPESDTAGVAANIERYLELTPDHISTYLLTLDHDSVMAQRNPKLPSDEELNDQYYTIRRLLTAAGFEHYEISNFAHSGKESRHNLTYWEALPYAGLGASAAGWLAPYRYQNPSDIVLYTAMIERGEIMGERELIDQSLEQQEYTIMRLRLRDGIERADFQHRFGADFVELYGTQIAKLQGLGMLNVTTERICLTEQALFVSNMVIAELI